MAPRILWLDGPAREASVPAADDGSASFVGADEQAVAVGPEGSSRDADTCHDS